MGKTRIKLNPYAEEESKQLLHSASDTSDEEETKEGSSALSSPHDVRLPPVPYTFLTAEEEGAVRHHPPYNKGRPQPLEMIATFFKPDILGKNNQGLLKNVRTKDQIDGRDVVNQQYITGTNTSLDENAEQRVQDYIIGFAHTDAACSFNLQYKEFQNYTGNTNLKHPNPGALSELNVWGNTFQLDAMHIRPLIVPLNEHNVLIVLKEGMANTAFEPGAILRQVIEMEEDNPCVRINDPLTQLSIKWRDTYPFLDRENAWVSVNEFMTYTCYVGDTPMTPMQIDKDSSHLKHPLCKNTKIGAQRIVADPLLLAMQPHLLLWYEALLLKIPGEIDALIQHYCEANEEVTQEAMIDALPYLYYCDPHPEPSFQAILSNSDVAALIQLLEENKQNVAFRSAEVNHFKQELPDLFRKEINDFLLECTVPPLFASEHHLHKNYFYYAQRHFIKKMKAYVSEQFPTGRANEKNAALTVLKKMDPIVKEEIEAAIEDLVLHLIEVLNKPSEYADAMTGEAMRSLYENFNRKIDAVFDGSKSQEMFSEDEVSSYDRHLFGFMQKTNQLILDNYFIDDVLLKIGHDYIAHINTSFKNNDYPVSFEHLRFLNSLAEVGRNSKELRQNFLQSLIVHYERAYPLFEGGGRIERRHFVKLMSVMEALSTFFILHMKGEQVKKYTTAVSLYPPLRVHLNILLRFLQKNDFRLFGRQTIGQDERVSFVATKLLVDAHQKSPSGQEYSYLEEKLLSPLLYLKRAFGLELEEAEAIGLEGVGNITFEVKHDAEKMPLIFLENLRRILSANEALCKRDDLIFYWLKKTLKEQDALYFVGDFQRLKKESNVEIRLYDTSDSKEEEDDVSEGDAVEARLSELSWRYSGSIFHNFSGPRYSGQYDQAYMLSGEGAGFELTELGSFDSEDSNAPLLSGGVQAALFSGVLDNQFVEKPDLHIGYQFVIHVLNTTRFSSYEASLFENDFSSAIEMVFQSSLTQQGLGELQSNFVDLCNKNRLSLSRVVAFFCALVKAKKDNISSSDNPELVMLIDQHLKVLSRFLLAHYLDCPNDFEDKIHEVEESSIKRKKLKGLFFDNFPFVLCCCAESSFVDVQFFSDIVLALQALAKKEPAIFEEQDSELQEGEGFFSYYNRNQKKKFSDAFNGISALAEHYYITPLIRNMRDLCSQLTMRYDEDVKELKRHFSPGRVRYLLEVSEDEFDRRRNELRRNIKEADDVSFSLKLRCMSALYPEGDNYSRAWDILSCAIDDKHGDYAHCSLLRMQENLTEERAGVLAKFIYLKRNPLVKLCLHSLIVLGGSFGGFDEEPAIVDEYYYALNQLADHLTKRFIPQSLEALGSVIYKSVQQMERGTFHFSSEDRLPYMVMLRFASTFIVFARSQDDFQMELSDLEAMNALFEFVKNQEALSDGYIDLLEHIMAQNFRNLECYVGVLENGCQAEIDATLSHKDEDASMRRGCILS